MFVPRSVNRKPALKRPVKRPVTATGGSETNPVSDETQQKHVKLADESDTISKEQPLTSKRVGQSIVDHTQVPHTLVEKDTLNKSSEQKCDLIQKGPEPLDESISGTLSERDNKDRTSSESKDDVKIKTNEAQGKDDLEGDRHASGSAQCKEQLESREGDDQEEEPPIVSFSKNQRWPEPDEPVCVVCGRYGEYICSRTDVDICSLECKARNLARSINKQSASRLMELTGIPESPSTSSSPSAASSSLSASAEGVDKEKALPETLSQPVGYRYHEHEDITDLNKEQVQELRAQVEIFVEGVDIPRPIVEFSQLGMPNTMNINLENAGYMSPTPVQMQVIPAVLYNRDLMVCAQTSSGKTASFLIPSILHMYNDVSQDSECKHPLTVILTPTRELAMQIEEQAKQLMKGLPNTKTALLVGGMPLPTQLHRLRQRIQLIIATPGRLMEIIQKNGVTLQSVKTLIIDEFDTMLHMGFQQQVMDILVHLPEPHQTLLFSATIPKSREQVASSLLGNPIYISIGTPSTPCASVKQIVMWVEEPSKKKKLFAILQDPKHYRPPIVVFVDSKLGADLLAETIEKVCEISAVSLHGDKPQNERTAILQGFLSGEHPVIVCTGVLGRGIDLPGVTMVINFDMPSSVEEYIHQIGRTGRLGSKGTAVTFINNGAKHLFLEFVNTLKPLGIQLPLQLVNSQHLHNQRQKHTSRKAQQMKLRKTHMAGYFGRKQRDSNWGSVGDLLAKRKRKTKL